MPTTKAKAARKTATPSEPPAKTQEEQIAETIAAAKATAKQPPAPDPEPLGPPSEPTAQASSAIAAATTKAAQNLAKTDKAAQRALIQTGRKDAIADVGMYAASYQLNVLQGVSAVRARTLTQLHSHLKQLHEHTDSTFTQEELALLGEEIEIEAFDPLIERAKEMGDRDRVAKLEALKQAKLKTIEESDPFSDLEDLAGETYPPNVFAFPPIEGKDSAPKSA